MALTKYTGNKPQRNIRATFSNYMDAWITWFLDVFMQEIDGVVDALNLNDVSDTSNTSITIDLAAGKTATVSSGKGFLKGMFLIFADNAAPTANYMVAQVVNYSGTTLTFDPVTRQGSGTKSDWVISFHAKPQLAVGDHHIYLTNGNGYGSTNTKCRRYSVVQSSAGTALTRTDTAADGTKIAINESGLYVLERNDVGAVTIGFSKNSTELTVNIKSIAATDRIGINTGYVSSDPNFSITVPLSASDFIYMHDSASCTDTGNDNWVRMTKVANL